MLKTPAIFFSRHSKQIQTSRHSGRMKAFDWLSVGAFVYQPIRMLCFVTFFPLNYLISASNLPQNCIFLSQSESRNFFMYIIIRLIEIYFKLGHEEPQKHSLPRLVPSLFS